MTPTVNAWIAPCNRLVSNSKNLVYVTERRTLSVLACLMMETVSCDRRSSDLQRKVRFASLEHSVSHHPVLPQYARGTIF